MSNNNEHWHVDFGFAGPHTTLHHQCFQMVDLIMLNFKRTMNGLNPRALTYEPAMHDDDMTKIKEERKDMLEEDELIQPKDHKVRKCRNVEGKV